ncbi:hypothetical protein WICPIJ_009949 [Wickerhamomyces pijperi]|uniref:Uncharacterized protein n=1 Tax=Wickerhamomyces pijperi TaxID=599730 RepID=A0A9P8PJ06_WICPI|nr:hypothetical protein WICPIJ_009949 [Wickerhamomyces pijperi]
MAFKVSSQALILRSTPTTGTSATSSSASASLLTADLINWASQHHQTSSNSTNNQLMRSFIIPSYSQCHAVISKISNYSWRSSPSSYAYTSSFASFPSQLSKNGRQHQQLSIRYQSSKSISSSSVEKSMLSDSSAFLLDKSKQHIVELLDNSEGRYTKEDIDTLCELVGVLGSNSRSSQGESSKFVVENHSRISEILLRYRRYDTLVNFINLQNQEQHFSNWELEDLGYLIKASLLQPSCNTFTTSIFELIRHLPVPQLKALAPEITNHFMNVNKKPMKAFEFWIHSVQVIHPDFKLANHSHSRHFMQLLTTILNRCNVVNDVITTSGKMVTDPEHRRNLNLSLSFAYLRADKFKSNVELWLLTHQLTKYGDTQWLNTIKSYFALGQFEKGYQLWLEGVRRAGVVEPNGVKSVCESFELIQDMNRVSQDTLRDVLKTGLIPIKSVKRLILKSISHCKSTQSKSIMPAYQLYQSSLRPSQSQESIDIINIFLEQVDASNTTEYELFQELMSEIGPNAGSFLVILKDLAQSGDLTSASKLIEVVSQQSKDKYLTVDHYTELLNLMINHKADDLNLVNETLTNLRKSMKTLEIKPDLRFVDRLIKLKWKVGNYAQVKTLYERFVQQGVIVPGSTNLGLLDTVIKALFRLKDYEAAKSVWSIVEDTVVKSVNGKNSGYYAIKLNYLAELGKVEQVKLIINQIMPADKIVVNSRHYHSLFSVLNRKKLYTEVVEEYSKIPQSMITSRLYRDLLLALVRLEVINRGNFDNPHAIVQDLLESDNQHKKKFHFKSIKPLVTTLTKLHQQDRALDLITRFEQTQREHAAANTLNLIKAKLLIYGKSSTQSSQQYFKLLFAQFQELMRNILSHQDKAPHGLKKVYGPLIKPLIRHYEQQRSLKDFASMFSDLVFIHKFTFDSKTYNYTVRHLLRNQQTFQTGLMLIERKLIGGYVHNVNEGLRLGALRRRGTHGASPRVGGRGGPTIAWGTITREQNVNMIYNYILRIVRSGETAGLTKDEIIEKHLKVKYPRLIKSIERKLKKRFEARDRAMERMKLQLKGEEKEKSNKLID